MNPQALPLVTTIAYVLHIGGGTIGLVSGTVALIARKGERVHRTAGTIFFVSMLVMAVFAGYLAIVIPNQIPNLFAAGFAFYMVSTAWLTVRRKEKSAGLAEKISLLVALLIFAPFAILSFQMLAGLPPLFNSAVPIRGPVLIALYGVTAILAIAALGDANTVLSAGLAGAPRIARHLWRMCFGMTIAAGSAFTNGLPHLLVALHLEDRPHVPAYFFYPQFIPLILLVYWMIRVRFTGWLKPQAIAAAS